LLAGQQLEKGGYEIRLCIDLIFIYEGWEEDYLPASGIVNYQFHRGPSRSSFVYNALGIFSITTPPLCIVHQPGHPLKASLITIACD
jgi:hypothetical protein